MTEKNPKIQYRRLILIYSLAMLIPGIILGVMAIRGFQGNISLREKIRDERLARQGQKFFQSVEHSVEEYFSSFNEKDIQWDQPHLWLDDNSIAAQKVDEGVVLSMAGWQADSAVKFLDRTTLFVRDHFWDERTRGLAQLTQLIRCREFEFESRDNIRARLSYTVLNNQAKDLFIKLEALMGEARMYRFMHQYSDCKESYREIFELTKYPILRNQSVVEAWDAMGDIILGWFQNLTLQINRDSPELAAIEILAFLGLPQIHLTETQHLELHRNSKELFESMVRENPQTEKYVDLIDSLFSVRELKIFQNRIAVKLSDQIIKQLTTDENQEINAISTFIPYSEDSLSVLAAVKHLRSYRISLILDMKKVLQKNIESIEKGLNTGNKIHWQILDESGRVIFTDPEFDDKKYSYSNIPVKIGFWTLKLQEESRGWMGMVFEAGQQVYLISILFVFIVMLIGLILTIRGITQDYKLTRLKSDFISTISHEFKSPLTAIRQMSEMLSMDRISKENRKKDYYNSMLAQSERLSHLVDNILDFSRMEDGRKKYNFQACDMEGVVREVVEMLKLRYKEEGFDLELLSDEKLPEVKIDCDSIQQVIYNLIDNAHKYSGEKKEIEVKLWKVNGMAAVQVKDYGMGISKKDQRKIFKKFYRSENVSAKGIAGSGIGLSIVAQIIRAHDGNIELISELGKGSRFRIFIPVEPKVER